MFAIFIIKERGKEELNSKEDMKNLNKVLFNSRKKCWNKKLRKECYKT